MISELRTLIAVARHGTFAATGNRIGLTQAAVSGHMRRLEDALGFQLFERTGRSARLNEAGIRTVRQAQEIISSFDALGKATSDEVCEGPLRIGAITSMQVTIVAQALGPFRTRFPLCRVQLSPGVSLQLMDRFDAGEIDLAVLIRPSFAPPREMLWVPLVQEDYALIVPADLVGDDWRAILAEQPFIRYDRASLGGRQVERFLLNGSVKVREWLEVDDLDAMVSMVAKGLGVAIIPMTEAVLPLPSTVREMTLGADTIRREIGILRRATEPSAFVTGAIDCLLASRSVHSV